MMTEIQNKQLSTSPDATSKQSEKGILVWNRKERQFEKEAVFGEAVLRFGYQTSLGRAIVCASFFQKLMSFFYGWYKGTWISRVSISSFVRKFQVPLYEFENQEYRSFNDFFIRSFKPGMRSFQTESTKLSAFAEGRYFAFDCSSNALELPVKGAMLNTTILLGSKEVAEEFLGGPVLIARLCPTDYHRFHFPDDGEVLHSYSLKGPLHSVNPVALETYSDILFTNERRVTVIKTRNFKKLAYIEVGALCVGRIVQSFEGSVFSRGQEKGFFMFGGSTVILLGEEGAWRPCRDLLEKTLEGFETFVPLGGVVGEA